LGEDKSPVKYGSMQPNLKYRVLAGKKPCTSSRNAQILRQKLQQHKLIKGKSRPNSQAAMGVGKKKNRCPKLIAT